MELMKLLETRRTYRRFNQSKKIPQPVINDIVNSIGLASSAANLQPLRYTFVTEEVLSDKLFNSVKWAARLPKELGTPKEGEKPVMYVVVWYDEKDKNNWIDIDLGLAISNMTLAAWNHGVGSCIFGSMNPKEVSELMGYDETAKVASVIAFGYPTHTSTLVEMEDDQVAYRLDDDKNYIVPKRKLKDIVKIYR